MVVLLNPLTFQSVKRYPSNSMKKISFYNRNGRWFADLPEYIAQGGTEDDCEMVAGADSWLEYLSKGSDRVTLSLSTSPLRNKLTLYESDEFGATYIAHDYNEEIFNHRLWLCPVTLFVFGEYPQTIYYE